MIGTRSWFRRVSLLNPSRSELRSQQRPVRCRPMGHGRSTSVAWLRPSTTPPFRTDCPCSRCVQRVAWSCVLADAPLGKASDATRFCHFHRVRALPTRYRPLVRVSDGCGVVSLSLFVGGNRATRHVRQNGDSAASSVYDAKKASGQLSVHALRVFIFFAFYTVGRPPRRSVVAPSGRISRWPSPVSGTCGRNTAVCRGCYHRTGDAGQSLHGRPRTQGP